MKRSFVCLLLALALCLALTGCGGRMDGGMVTSSPAAVSATPVIPSMDVSLTPEPEHTAAREQPGTGTGNGTSTGSDTGSAAGVNGR